MSDAEPTKSDEPAEAASAAGKSPRLGARRLRIIRALLAPVLVAGAVGVHFAVNVPEEKVVQPKPSKAKKKTRRTPRPAIPERTAKQLDAAWQRWSVEPYEGEPIKGKWGRRMQTTVNKAVILARKEAFEGAPEDPRVVVSGTQCRTIRCRFVLRSPFEHEPGLVVEAMKRQMYKGESLWVVVDAKRTDPPNEHSPKDDHYVQVTLGIRFDVVDTRDIIFEPAEGEKGEKAPAEGEKASAEGEKASAEGHD